MSYISRLTILVLVVSAGCKGEGYVYESHESGIENTGYAIGWVRAVSPRSSSLPILLFPEK